MAPPETCLADFMEATARNQKGTLPETYGYQADVAMGIGYWMETTNQCKVVEKPFVVPNGLDDFQGYVILYAYCSEEGVKSILEGQLPPMLPATTKEPSSFPTLEAISENFGAKDPKAASVNSKFCVALRVPAELTTKADTPGRDLWIVRFDQDLISPFLQAAKEGNVAKLKAGLEAGVKADVVDEDGVSALMMAAMTGSAEACEVLLKGGAGVNWAERNAGRTALMFASQGGHLDAVKTLLAAKADTSKVDSEGQTSLHWAAVGGRLEVAKLLASIGQKGAKNKEGQTPADVAEKMKHEETAAALK
ncbi:unnamed protein product [Effrenium voratum]|uniref:Uncharacterized protein n=1 Tax=Effrenium voratum TaxID=2562239 RepID=A0AA36MNC3_9DINO|nr:unnamed protein product [Effrenium voratum]CAJ1420317.1 unnamed protein product [Effrenium voratum]|mmetsp:Transcript_97351/g.231622  ORF Transcript_97351/g.231622 Transcript_97351/m.231622 type:complete len:307 (+) Transcript_97351:63-983(+)